MLPLAVPICMICIAPEAISGAISILADKLTLPAILDISARLIFDFAVPRGKLKAAAVALFLSYHTASVQPPPCVVISQYTANSEVGPAPSVSTLKAPLVSEPAKPVSKYSKQDSAKVPSENC